MNRKDNPAKEWKEFTFDEFSGIMDWRYVFPLWVEFPLEDKDFNTFPHKVNVHIVNSLEHRIELFLVTVETKLQWFLLMEYRLKKLQEITIQTKDLCDYFIDLGWNTAVNGGET